MNEAELVFTEMLQCDRPSLYLDGGRRLDKKESVLLSEILRKRIKGEPVQYILGRSEFMGFAFGVCRGVLIPRPETEILVEAAKDILSTSGGTNPNPHILELGTGSGCIAVSLARLISGALITATDISAEALAVARLNALLNHVRGRVKFLKSDLFKSRQLCPLGYEMIISNPPYVPSAEIPLLAPEVHCEPILALDGGRDGLDFYRRIIKQACRYLKAGGFLLMEIGINQREPIEKIFLKMQGFKTRGWIKDYNHIERVVVAQKAG